MNVLIAIFPEKICCNVSYENLYLNVGIMVAYGLWSFVYFINFQIRQIPATNHFSLEKIILFLLSILLCGHDFWKKNINVSGLKSLCKIMVSKYGHLMLPGCISHRLRTFLFLNMSFEPQLIKSPNPANWLGLGSRLFLI